MSQDVRQNDLAAQSQELLQGPLKHARGAALAMALVPLAAVAATAQDSAPLCPSGGICGTVFQDVNGNGIQDPGEPGIPGVSVTIYYTDEGTPYTFTVMTNEDGLYEFGTGIPQGEWTISTQIPNNTTASPANQGSDDTTDSDGVSDGNGNSVAKVTWDGTENASTDFGFTESAFSNPGTGTPGYWKNHPEAWPVSTITVGGATYTKDQAIALLNKVGKDRTLTMFSSLVPAMLNVMIGNDSTCVAATIAAAQDWMTTYGPVGSNVHASSYAWKVGEPLHRLMDNYNNGMLCAPNRE